MTKPTTQWMRPAVQHADCATCGAKAGSPCVSVGGGRAGPLGAPPKGEPVKAVHRARRVAYWGKAS